MNAEPVFMMREGFLDPRNERHPWRQYLVITDACVVLVEMTPALVRECWNFKSRTVQTGDDWYGLDRDQIVAWKLRHDPEYSRVLDMHPESGFRARLLAYARGEMPERSAA